MEWSHPPLLKQHGHVSFAVRFVTYKDRVGLFGKKTQSAPIPSVEVYCHTLSRIIRLITMRGIDALAFLAAIGAAHGQSTVGFGPYFSLGPTQSWIREANTTLVLPEAPSPQKDRLALWPGMGTSGGDLIQALAVSFSDPNS